MNNAWSGSRAGGDTEIRVIDVHVRGARSWICDEKSGISYSKGRVVGYVEHLDAKFQFFRLCNRRNFHDPEVPVEKRRAIEGVAWQVPDHPRLWIAKAARNQWRAGQTIIGSATAIRTDKLRIDEQDIAIRLICTELAGDLLWGRGCVHRIGEQRPG